MKYLNASNAFKASSLALIFSILAMGTYFATEPVVSRAITSNFTVAQTITAEISFLVSASNVTMSPSIAGLTGGYATGTTQVVISTNSATGYNMTIVFSSSTAMNYNNGTAYINNYSQVATSAPDYAFAIAGAGTPAEFGYTVTASGTPTTEGLVQYFLDNGSNTCGTGSTDGFDKCWSSPSTTARTIINRATPTAVTGATTTLKFVVGVPSSPSPLLTSGIYYATATLTAVTQ